MSSSLAFEINNIYVFIDYGFKDNNLTFLSKPHHERIIRTISSSSKEEYFLSSKTYLEGIFK